MQKIEFVLFQIDQARMLLQEGSLPAIRVALMLLDNSVELLLDRWIEDDMGHENIYERIIAQAHKKEIPKDIPELEHLFTRRYFKASEKKKLARFFDEKVIYMTKIKKIFPQYIGKILSQLHRYRNQAYHSGVMRPEIFKTFTTIYYELCCRLFEYISFSSICYYSADNFSWIKNKFGVDILNFNEDMFPKILENLRTGFLANENSLQKILIENLEQRVKEVLKNLHFISVDCGISSDQVSALSKAKRFTIANLKKFPPYEPIPPNLEKRLTFTKIKSVEKNINYIKKSNNELYAFKKYADSDVFLERIEFVVNKFVNAINQAIEMQSDLKRGK